MSLANVNRSPVVSVPGAPDPVSITVSVVACSITWIVVTFFPADATDTIDNTIAVALMTAAAVIAPRLRILRSLRSDRGVCGDRRRERKSGRSRASVVLVRRRLGLAAAHEGRELLVDRVVQAGILVALV